MIFSHSTHPADVSFDAESDKQQPVVKNNSAECTKEIEGLFQIDTDWHACLQGLFQEDTDQHAYLVEGPYYQQLYCKQCLCHSDMLYR